MIRGNLDYNNNNQPASNLNNHFYIPQTPEIGNVIHSIWQAERFHTFDIEHILPKGVVEIIFNFSDSDPILARLNGNTSHLSKCFINGFNTKPIQLQIPKSQLFFGVTFQPLAIKKIFGTPASEFSDITVDVTLLDSSFHSLWHQLREQIDFDNRVLIFVEWIRRNFIDWQPQEKLINHFLYNAKTHEVTVKELANTLFYSARQLSRKLSEATGMNTEEILLYKKYLYAVDLIHQTELSLTEIAYQSNFSDQSHFIKTFKNYTAITPGEYKRNKSFVKGHIFENVR